VECGSACVMIDGGPGAEPKGHVAAWLVTDRRGELIREIRKLARPRGLEPIVSRYSSELVSITPHNVIHTSHETYGYAIRFYRKKIVWAPEFLLFPTWAKGAHLMFAEAAGWSRPILFRGRVGGHASVEQVASDAQKYKIKKLVFAHRTPDNQGDGCRRAPSLWRVWSRWNRFQNRRQPRPGRCSAQKDPEVVTEDLPRLRKSPQLTDAFPRFSSSKPEKAKLQ